jgi:hypothetical protein
VTPNTTPQAAEERLAEDIKTEARIEGDSRYTLRTSAVAFHKGAEFAMNLAIDRLRDLASRADSPVGEPAACKEQCWDCAESGIGCNLVNDGRASPSEAQKAVARDWNAVEAAIDSYIEDYEMLGEAEDGRDACYTPNDNDRALMKDFALGLLSDDAFMAALTTPSPAASMEVQGLTMDEIQEAWYECAENRVHGAFLAGAEFGQRALAAKNGWRLGEGRG